MYEIEPYPLSLSRSRKDRSRRRRKTPDSASGHRHCYYLWWLPGGQCLDGLQVPWDGGWGIPKMVDSEYFSEFFRKVWAVYTIGVALHGESINTVPSASVLQWKERKKTQCIKAACSDASLSHKAVKVLQIPFLFKERNIIQVSK